MQTTEESKVIQLVSVFGLSVMSGDFFPTMSPLAKQQCFDDSDSVKNFCRLHYYESGFQMFLVVHDDGRIGALYPSDCDC